MSGLSRRPARVMRERKRKHCTASNDRVYSAGLETKRTMYQRRLLRTERKYIDGLFIIKEEKGAYNGNRTARFENRRQQERDMGTRDGALHSKSFNRPEDGVQNLGDGARG